MDPQLLERQRLTHYQLGSAKRIITLSDAARYIQRYGFCWLFAPRDRKLELPALYEAVKGKRDAHIEDWDKDSEKIWAWKNDLPAAHRAYYGKAFAGKPVFISLPILPAVIAALGLEDVGRAYAHGALSYDAKRIYDALAQFGAQPTQTLKRNAGFVGKDGSARYHHGLDELQHKLVVSSMGATGEGAAWPSQIFDLVSNWFKPQSQAAAKMDLPTARAALIDRYLKTVIAAPPEAVARLFAIPRPELQPILDDLIAHKRIRQEDKYLITKSRIANSG